MEDEDDTQEQHAAVSRERDQQVQGWHTDYNADKQKWLYC